MRRPERVLRPRPVRELSVNEQRVEMCRKDVVEKWSGPGGLRLTVPSNAANMLDREEHLAGMVHELCHDGVVCEVGCGYGRVSRLFDDDKYIGVDINQDCIDAARKGNPGKKFKHIDWDDTYPEADCYLFFTVMLHVPDSDVQNVIRKLSGRVVVCECMSGWIRRYGAGNNFQRDPNTYEDLFTEAGKQMLGFYHMPVNIFPYFINIMVFG